jgi:hypothetical protein
MVLQDACGSGAESVPVFDQQIANLIAGFRGIAFEIPHELV